jgi:hypothetical protein
VVYKESMLGRNSMVTCACFAPCALLTESVWCVSFHAHLASMVSVCTECTAVDTKRGCFAGGRRPLGGGEGQWELRSVGVPGVTHHLPERSSLVVRRPQ